jgi:hypothetical protein
VTASQPPSRIVHVLLFDPGSDQEGIHSLELLGRTVVLLFEEEDDAERYAGLLEAQDFPVPSVEALDREELEAFCRQEGYEARFVPAGFLPKSEEDRLLIAPPERNIDDPNWRERTGPAVDAAAGPAGDTQNAVEDAAETDAAVVSGDPELEAFRRSLEGLL